MSHLGTVMISVFNIWIIYLRFLIYDTCTCTSIKINTVTFLYNQDANFEIVFQQNFILNVLTVSINPHDFIYTVYLFLFWIKHMFTHAVRYCFRKCCLYSFNIFLGYSSIFTHLLWPKISHAAKSNRWSRFFSFNYFLY